MSSHLFDQQNPASDGLLVSLSAALQSMDDGWLLAEMMPSRAMGTDLAAMEASRSVDSKAMHRAKQGRHPGTALAP